MGQFGPEEPTPQEVVTMQLHLNALLAIQDVHQQVEAQQKKEEDDEKEEKEDKDDIAAAKRKDMHEPDDTDKEKWENVLF